MVTSDVANGIDGPGLPRVVRAGPAAGEDRRAAAFRQFVGDELDRAYRLAAVILGDRFEAEDAVHDAAVAAWSRWNDLRDPARFEAWFGRILVNTCRDRLRRRHRRAVELIRDPLETEGPVADDPGEAGAARDAVRRALETLSAEERIAVVLRYEADLTVAAIAAVVGAPEGTIKSRLHHALGRLRASIEEDGR